MGHSWVSQMSWLVAQHGAAAGPRHPPPTCNGLQARYAALPALALVQADLAVCGADPLHACVHMHEMMAQGGMTGGMTGGMRCRQEV